MKKRMLGTLEVSAIGMGCMGMSHAAGKPMDMDEAARTVPVAYSEQALEVYPSAELKVIPDAGHGFYGEEVRRQSTGS